MIKNISIENFRVFKEKTTFDLRPFTILTGPNNSGKSSLIKFLLLLKEGVLKLNFEQGNHNLENFKNVINWNSESEILKFRFDFSEFQGFEFSYKLGVLKSINFYLNNKLLYEFSEHLGKGLILYPDDKNVVYTYRQLKKFNLRHLIETIYLSNKELVKLDKKIKNLNRDYLLYKIYVSNKDLSEKYKEEIYSIQEEIFKEEIEHVIDADGGDIIKTLLSALKYLIDGNKKKVLTYFKELLGTKEVEIKYTKLGEFIFGNKTNTYENGYTEVVYANEFKFEYINFFNTYVINITHLIRLDLKNLHYISANRGSQKRILKNKSENDIDEIILEFTQTKIKHLDFINKAFIILGIKGKLKIERYENVISTVYLETQNGKLSLADLGYGYSQVIPIILKINNIFSNQSPEIFSSIMDRKITRNNDMLILEEPEANLHPNLQSKLADVLVLANQTFGLNFLIETHSEYLIRKLQYLTAKKEIDKNNLVIYYFNSDEYVTPKEKKVKEIEINETGGLSDSFGPGFFDESTKLQFELIKINKDQIN